MTQPISSTAHPNYFSNSSISDNLSNLKLQNGDSPLHYAIRHRNAALLKQALEAGFSIADRNNDGLNALDLAMLSDDPELSGCIVQTLWGIDPATIAPLLDRRVMAKGLSQVEKTIHEWKSKSSRAGQMTPAGQAAARGDEASLLSFDSAALKAVDFNGLTPLHYAILNNQEAAVDFLASRSDAKFLTDDGKTYLHFAALSGNDRIVQSIQKLDIPIDALDRQKLTAAHYFAAAGSPENLTGFIKKGASLTTSTPDGLTPIGLLFAKALSRQKTDLVSSKDLWLAFSNALQAGLLIGFAYQMQTADPLLFPEEHFMNAAPLIAAFAANFIAKQWIVSTLPSTQNSYGIFRWSVRPLGYLANCAIASVPGAVLSSVSSVCMVMKNSLMGFGRCIKNFTSRPISAIGAASVHLFNAGMETLPYLLMGALYLEARKQGFSWSVRSDVSDSCPMPDLSDLSPLDRAARLNPSGCSNHAKQLLAGQGFFNETRFQDEGCSYIKKLYRSMVLQLHPDRNPGQQRLANTAFHHLTDAVETLCP
jgi:ankyrin repeat protein